jgi:hypothetical protein
VGTPLCVFLVVNTLKEHRWFFNMQLLIGHGQVPTIMPEASFFIPYVKGNQTCRSVFFSGNKSRYVLWRLVVISYV